MSESLSQTINVAFRSLDGRRTTHDVRRNLPISELSVLLEEDFQIPVASQRLIYRGRAIDSGSILSDYVTEAGHTIHVVRRQEPVASPSVPTVQPLPSTAPQNPVGMLVGSMTIERGSSDSGFPQVSITTDLPMNGAQSILRAFMSSFGNVAGAVAGTPAGNATTSQPAAAQSEGASAPTAATSNSVGVTGIPAFAAGLPVFQGAGPSAAMFQGSTTGAPPLNPFGQMFQSMASFPGIPAAHMQAHAEAVARARAQHEAGTASSILGGQNDVTATTANVAEVANATSADTQSGQIMSPSAVNTSAPSADHPAPEAEIGTAGAISPSEEAPSETATTVPQADGQTTSTTVTTSTEGGSGQPTRVTQTTNTHPLLPPHTPVAATPLGEGGIEMFGAFMNGQNPPIVRVIPRSQTGIDAANAMHQVLHAASHAQNVASQQQRLQQAQQSRPAIIDPLGIFNAVARQAGIPSSTAAVTHPETQDRAQSAEAAPSFSLVREFMTTVASTLASSSRRIAAAEESLAQSIEAIRTTPPTTTLPHEAESTANVGGVSAPTLTPSATAPSAVAFSTNEGPAGQSRQSTLTVSNDHLDNLLPWTSLNELSETIRRSCGFTLPRMTARLSPNSPAGLSTFILMYQQLRNVASSLLFQLEAWQIGHAGFALADIGHTIRALALMSEIDASLSSAISWIFANMALCVSPEALSSLISWEPDNENNRTAVRITHTPHSEAPDDEDFHDADEGLKENVDTNFNRKRSTETSESHETESKKQKRETTNQQFVELSSSSSSTESIKDAKIADDAKVADKDEVHVERIIEHAIYEPQSSSQLTQQSTTKVDALPTQSRSSERIIKAPSRGDQILTSVETLMNSLTQNSNTPDRNQSSSQATRDSGLSNLPDVVRRRYERWISDPVVFSRSVLSQARQRPFSNAYQSGDPLVSQTPLPSVSSFFNLIWRQTASRLNIPDHIFEIPDHLAQSHIHHILNEIAHSIRQHPDFRMIDPNHLSNLHELLRKVDQADQ